MVYTPNLLNNLVVFSPTPFIVSIGDNNSINFTPLKQYKHKQPVHLQKSQPQGQDISLK